QLMHELVDVAERAVHRGEAHVRDGVELVQLAHHGLADRAAGDLPLAALLELALDLVDQGLDGVDRDRALLAGALEPVHDLGALEGLPPAVLLDHHGERLLDPLVGGEGWTAVLAVTPAAVRGPYLAAARVYHPVLHVVS